MELHEVSLGGRCRSARLAAGLTQDEAAFRLRLILPKGRCPAGSVISRIESGRIVRPEPYVMAAMAEVYGVSLLDLAPEMADEVAMIAKVLTRCAPWDSNPEPADYTTCAGQEALDFATAA